MNYFEIKNNTIDESVIHEIRPFLIEKWRKYMTIFIGIFMLFLRCMDILLHMTV